MCANILNMDNNSNKEIIWRKKNTQSSSIKNKFEVKPITERNLSDNSHF